MTTRATRGATSRGTGSGRIRTRTRGATLILESSHRRPPSFSSAASRPNEARHVANIYSSLRDAAVGWDGADSLAAHWSRANAGNLPSPRRLRTMETSTASATGADSGSHSPGPAVRTAADLPLPNVARRPRSGDDVGGAAGCGRSGQEDGEEGAGAAGPRSRGPCWQRRSRAARLGRQRLPRTPRRVERWSARRRRGAI